MLLGVYNAGGLARTSLSSHLGMCSLQVGLKLKMIREMVEAAVGVMLHCLMMFAFATPEDWDFQLWVIIKSMVSKLFDA